MALPNIFTQSVLDKLIGRINHLTSATTPFWGKMSVSQMLAHCNVSYEMAFEDKHSKPNFFMGFILKNFIKKALVDDITPYKQNSPTAPAFIIKEDKNFEIEKKRLIDYLKKSVELGESYFDGKESLSFGKMSATEWNNLFYKHIDHHLTQFGV
jgi:Protein of unknown function (DUF1569)